MIDFITASDNDPWIISVSFLSPDAYRHFDQIIEQVDAINLGLA